MDTPPTVLRFPFTGRWITRNSPADRVPSHGTHLFGTTYAIDFVAVNDDGHSARRGWRSWVATEPPEVFAGFGVPILAPVGGLIVAAVDGETDHAARRSPLALIPYALFQAGRARRGVRAIAGNHVVIRIGPSGPFVLLAHLQQGSVRVAVGAVVEAGETLAACGNSGNSTEPHVHVQVTESTSWTTTLGRPISFERSGHEGQPWLPVNGEVCGPAR